jgi:hypothetical protein
MGPTYAIAEKAADMIKVNATQSRTPNIQSGAKSISRSAPFAAVLFSLAASVLAVAL